MKPHYISHIHVEKLWGDKTLSFPLFEDVNVIIGPNASGKTTIINLLMFALTGNVVRLIDYHFDFIRIKLKEFDGGKELVIKVTRNQDGIEFEIDGNKVPIPHFPGSARLRHSGYTDVPPEILRRHFSGELFELRKQLEGVVPAAWLPVSRRLPMGEEDEDERRVLRRRSLESVDECLSELLEGLQRYRVSLDSKLSELRKEFQKHALANILFDKRHDRALDLKSFQPPTEEEKQQLLKAFRDVGYGDKVMEARVEEHFIAEQEAIKQIQKDSSQIDSRTLFIIPLIHRTKQMVEFAQHLERDRQTLFAPLSLYESTIKTFITGKRIQVSPRGELQISKEAKRGREILWKQLSSGEKQVLILLTQALLWEKDPVVYVADEPELSLHVTWQEMLLKSVRSLAGRCQIIVATHSPDIAGGFPKRIIDLAKL
jgi:predicted ATP-dependent endonuclease of OLD family